MTRFDGLQLHNPIVSSIVRSGGTAEDCVVALVAVNESLMAHIEELENIVPRKVRLPSGEVVLWRCPDDAVPEPA